MFDVQILPEGMNIETPTLVGYETRFFFVSSLIKQAVVVLIEQHNSSVVYYNKYQIIRCQPCQRQG